jgi:ketosteroid isomerase-like protein
MSKFLTVLLLPFVFCACNLFQKKQPAAGLEEKMKMMDADRAFSKLCETKGMKIAFMEYIDSNGVLLKPGELPIVGAEAIDFLIQQNDSAYQLQWKPTKGVIAASGELGFTYGLYALKLSEKDTTLYGTYINIWKKQSDGNWKYLLNSGNEGLNQSEQNQ